MPIVLRAALLLLTAGCQDYRAGFINAGGAPIGTARSIDEAYAARDACLAHNATERALAGSTARARAQALALTCATQTEKLVAVASRGSAAAGNAIRSDSGFRALGFVLKAPAGN